MEEIVVFPVASVVEARRCDGFTRLARAFDFNDDEHRHYVAFAHGSPIGFASVDPEGEIKAVHSAVGGDIVPEYLINNMKKHFSSLETMNISQTPSRGFQQISATTWKWAAGQDPKDLLEEAVPFVYDIKEDSISVGQPGTRTSDITGPFTPGGIVEGMYEPGGKVYVDTSTNMPFTVRHMIELWYYTQPQLEVKNVYFRDQDGKETKLASQDAGRILQANVASDPSASQATRALTQAGGRVVAVGGAVRDALMGKNPKDIDLLVQGLPADQVEATLKQLPGRVDFTGKDFGVFRYKEGPHEVEIALPRRERSTGEGHQDFEVKTDHAMPVEEDLGRRDFTANAMGVDLSNGELIDPYGGANDIANGVLRSVNEHALAEDPLRVVRALVAHSRHGLDPDEATRAQMAASGDSVTNLPQERVQAELDKIMASPDPAAAIRLARRTGVLRHVLPEVDSAFGYDQNNPHHELELGDHLLSVLDRTSKLSDDPDLRMAALLHDIGKPESAWVDPATGKNHYYEGPNGEGADHEDLGAAMARARLNSLRYPKDRVARITNLIQHHMWPAYTSPKGARRFLNRVGDHADDLLTLREADQGGKTYGNDPNQELPDLDQQRGMLDHIRQAQEPTNRAELAIDGNDLVAMGMQGPEVGATLDRLTQAVIDDPSLNNREALLQMAHG